MTTLVALHPTKHAAQLQILRELEKSPSRPSFRASVLGVITGLGTHSVAASLAYLVQKGLVESRRSGLGPRKVYWRTAATYRVVTPRTTPEGK